MSTRRTTIERNVHRGGTSCARSSNLELLRIISMLAIIAHHYVVNSGITQSYDFTNITANMVFLQLWGMWGKTAINVFVLITGYFMCTSKLTWQRFIKMYAEAKFYQILGFIVFAVAGYEVISAKSIFKLLFGYLYGVNNGFTPSFFAMYLFIPFLNKIIHRFSKKELGGLVLILLGLFTFPATFFFNHLIFHHVFWYIALYFLAAYIRLYPNCFTECTKYAGIALAVVGLLSYASVLVVDFIGSKLGFFQTYYMVSDSHKLFALILGVCAFVFFKNLKMPNSRLINAVSSTTFGVLLIHANSDAMRKWLWQDLLNVPGMYEQPLGTVIVHAFACMIGVFIVCAAMDYLRILFLEKPLFRWLSRKESKIDEVYLRIKEAVIKGKTQIYVKF